MGERSILGLEILAEDGLMKGIWLLVFVIIIIGGVNWGFTGLRLVTDDTTRHDDVPDLVAPIASMFGEFGKAVSFIIYLIVFLCSLALAFVVIFGMLPDDTVDQIKDASSRAMDSARSGLSSGMSRVRGNRFGFY